MKNEYNDVVICIQARMSSTRFPGKVIANVKGKPLIIYLFDRLTEYFNNKSIYILTSNEKSDDALIKILDEYNIQYFRGDLRNVFYRFTEFQKELDSNIKFIGRICGDSPLLNLEIVKEVIDNRNIKYDMITTRTYFNNTLTSTASKGNNFDLLNRKSLIKYEKSIHKFSEFDKEHIIFPFLRENYLTVDVSRYSNNIDVAVDTEDDLKRLMDLI